MNNYKDERNLIAEINVTPLTDIFLVLLIIFMITATAFVVEGKIVNLPESALAKPLTAGITVTVTKSLEIFVGGKKMSLAELKAFLLKKLPEVSDGNITLEADEDVALGMVVSVMDLAESIGIKRINISTRRK